MFQPHPDCSDCRHEQDCINKVLHLTFSEVTGDEKLTIAVNGQHVDGCHDKTIDEGDRETVKLVITVEKDHKVSKHPKQELYCPEIQLSHLTYGIHESNDGKVQKRASGKIAFRDRHFTNSLSGYSMNCIEYGGR